MPQFDLSTFPGQILWLAAIFALQYMFIAKSVIPGFMLVFNKRRYYIDRLLKEAQDFQNKSEALKTDYEQKFEELKKAHASLSASVFQEIETTHKAKLAALDKEFSDEIKAREEKDKASREHVVVALDEATLEVATNLLCKVTDSKVTKKQLSKYMN